MKLCGTCDTKKDVNQFHKRSASKDGLAAICRDCQKEYDAERASDPKRLAARLAYAKTPSGIKRASEAKAAYIAREPKKRRAHNAISNAIRDGKLSRKPCEICGSVKRVHAHHDDYAKIYDVRWLCNEHHREWHRVNGEAKNPH